MPANRRGQILIGVIALLMLAVIMIPALVLWVQQESRTSVQQGKATIAFNLAEGGIDRGMWKLKSTTSTWEAASQGTVIAGYDFDVTYTDHPEGDYRIRFTSGPANKQVTILAEGRDRSTREFRAIEAVFTNSTVPGAIISGGIITLADALEAQWGPLMAHGDITITDINSSNQRFPRKLSRQTVSSTVGPARDTNGLNPPNTDSLEWWSDFDVPELPIPDFATMRASATANGTLNIYGCPSAGPYGWGHNPAGGFCFGCFTNSHACRGGVHAEHFDDSIHHPLAKDNLIWYWDGNVTFSGGILTHGIGLYGTIIVRGDLTISNCSGDNFGTDTGVADDYPATIPTGAWQEYQFIDTAAANQYAGDIGLQSHSATFQIGNQSWTGGPSSPAYSDVGFRGFVYVGGSLTINGPCDFHGALWVVGNTSRDPGVERSIVFFNDSLELPTLNVVLVRESWRETSPDPAAWP